MIENNGLNRDKNFKVYMHTSPNGKRYIGITCQRPAKRWGGNGYGYVGNEYFWRAIQKYGWDNFKHEILFENLTQQEAEQKEIELIAYYDSTDPNKGYNITAGGSYSFNVELKPVKQYTIDGIFIQEYESIKYASELTGINSGCISLCCNDKAKTASGYIWRFSDVALTEEHISWCNSDGHKDKWIPVCQYSKDGKFIRRYENLTIAASETNTNPTSIISCCEGESKFTADSIWRYADEELTQEHIDWCNNGRGGKISVLQYSASYEFIERFDGIKSAGRLTGVNPTSIVRCCKELQETAGGFIWKYEFPELVQNTGYQKFNPVDQYSMSGEFIETYTHPTDAMKKTGINFTTIINCCKGEQRKSGGFIWRYHGDELTEEYIKWCNETYVQDTKKAVFQYSLDGCFIREWESLTSIKNELGFDVSAISRCCKDKQKFAYGFLWKFASDIQDPYAPLFPTTTPSPTLSETA